MKQIFKKASALIVIVSLLILACSKKDFISNSSTRTEKSISEKISYANFTNGIRSTDKLILKVRMTPKAAIANGYMSVMGAAGTNTFILQDFEIDTSKILAVRKSNNEIYYSMRLLSKKDSSNNCFYNLYVKKDSTNQITQTIVKYLPTAKSIKNNYKSFEAKCFVLQNNMNSSANTNSTVTTNSITTTDVNEGCVEVAYDIPCEYGYVHEEGDGPGIWCDGNGSYKNRFLNCGSGGTSSSGSGSATGGNGNGSGNSSGNVLVTPGSNTNNIITCEVPETDEFINQLYNANIGWASQNVNTFNQLCGSLCGNDSQTNKDEIQSTIDYLKEHPNETLTLTENSPLFEAADQANTVDINKIMKCFDNVPNTGATYQVKLCVDVPDNNNPNELWKVSTKAGHVFVTLTKTNGSQSVTQSFGFYPLNTLSAIEMGPVTSAIVNDGANPPHEYNASITMPNIPAGAFQALITAAKNYSTRSYALSNYNCAGYALDVFNTIRTTDLNSVHKTEQIKKFGVYVSVGFPQSPSGLYETLANMKNAGGSEAQNIEIGVVKPAASSKGECN